MGGVVGSGVAVFAEPGGPVGFAGRGVEVGVGFQGRIEAGDGIDGAVVVGGRGGMRGVAGGGGDGVDAGERGSDG